MICYGKNKVRYCLNDIRILFKQYTISFLQYGNNADKALGVSVYQYVMTANHCVPLRFFRSQGHIFGIILVLCLKIAYFCVSRTFVDVYAIGDS